MKIIRCFWHESARQTAFEIPDRIDHGLKLAIFSAVSKQVLPDN